MKKVFLSFVLLVVAGVGVYMWLIRENTPTLKTAEGKVIDVALGARVITIDDDGKEFYVMLAPDAVFSGERGKEVTPSYFEKGFFIKASGQLVKDGHLFAERVELIRAPNIIVLLPRPQDVVSSTSLKVKGRARVFENQLQLRIFGGGRIIAEIPVTANSSDIGAFGDFEKEIHFPVSLVVGLSEIFLEAFEYSAEDGREVNKDSVPLRVGFFETARVKIYFSNTKLDPEVSCTKVFSVERDIMKTPSIARAALEELLKGVSANEKEKGYFSSIPEDASIQGLAVQNGTARADFSEELEKGVGGSCRVTAIRAQITQTLKQFPTIKTVVISIGGRTENILQP